MINYMPFMGPQPFALKWYDKVVFFAFHIFAFGFVKYGLPDLHSWQYITVFAFVVFALIFTYSYERVRWHYIKMKNRHV